MRHPVISTMAAIQPEDRWHVFNLATNVSLESHPTEAAAAHARQVLNDHEERNGRPRVYAVKGLMGSFPSVSNGSSWAGD